MVGLGSGAVPRLIVVKPTSTPRRPFESNDGNPFEVEVSNSLEPTSSGC